MTTNPLPATPATPATNDDIPLDAVTATVVPKTDLGRRLLALRAEGVRAGIPLLTLDELDREIAERRGGTALWEYEERQSVTWPMNRGTVILNILDDSGTLHTRTEVAMAQRNPSLTVDDPNDDESHLDEATDAYVPRTELGRRLMALRQEIVQSGAPLLDWDDLDREIAERRGGVALTAFEDSTHY